MYKSNVTLGYSVVNLYPGKRVKVDRLIECNSNQYPGKVDRMCNVVLDAFSSFFDEKLRRNDLNSTFLSGEGITEVFFL